MDGENSGKPYQQMDNLEVFPIFLEGHPYVFNKNGHIKMECRYITYSAMPDIQLGNESNSCAGLPPSPAITGVKCQLL